jgi:hypothetical protein
LNTIARQILQGLLRLNCFHELVSAKAVMGGKLLVDASAEAASPPLSRVATSALHGEDSPYDENPYDAASNPSGVIQMGLAKNQVSFDLLEGYLRDHPEAAGWGGAKAGSGVASFRDNALFQDYHGLKAFRKAMASFKRRYGAARRGSTPTASCSPPARRRPTSCSRSSWLTPETRC